MSVYDREVRRAVSRVASASRKTHYSKPIQHEAGRLEEARQDLLAARLAKAIDEALNPPAPFVPLTTDRRAVLVDMLTGEGVL